MEPQRDHARTSAARYRQKDAALVRQEAEEELAEWRKYKRQPRERKQRVSTRPEGRRSAARPAASAPSTGLSTHCGGPSPPRSSSSVSSPALGSPPCQ